MRPLTYLALATSLVGASFAHAQNKVLVLNGLGRHVQVPHNFTQNTSAAITVEYWASIDQYAGRPVHKRSPSAGQFNTQFGANCGNRWGAELFGVGTVDGSPGSQCLPLPPSQSNQALFGSWNHYALTWSATSGRMRFYVNGVMVCDQYSASASMVQTTDPLCFGNVGDVPAASEFRGRLDNIRLWNTERTQQQIATTAMTVFNTAQSASMTGLIGSWSFDDGTAGDSKGQNPGMLMNGASIVTDDTIFHRSDCNGDGVLDAAQIALWQQPDSNNNGILDACECSPPTIISNPASGTICVGSPATFSASITGFLPTLQWRKNGIPILGAVLSTYTIPSTSFADSGMYDCVATNLCGSVTSSVASLTVEAITVVASQPFPQSLIPGTTGAFSLTASGSRLAYQWRRDGVNLANSSRITGVTTPNLIISAVAAGDQGSYDCVVTGSCGTVTSQAASLSCVPIITQHPPAEAILVPGASLSVTVPTNASYTYRWRQNGQNLFNIPGVIAGATTRTLTLLSDDSSLVGTYDCVLTNACGSTTSDATFIPCPADFNLDGGIDGGDVEAFFGDWSAGLGTADLNQDGGVDGGDMFTFFTRWEGGC